MHKIGIVQNLKHDFPTYSKELKELGFSLEFILAENLLEKLNQIDVCLIEEGQSLETCELILMLRKKSTSLIWILCEELSRINKLVYFELGVDGVADVTNEKELFLLQLCNILKKVKNRADCDYQKHTPSLYLNSNNLSVLKNGMEEISLTPLEFKVLNLLLKKRGKMVSYKEIYQTLWEEEKKNQLYRVNNLIFSLRKKLKDSSNQFYIRTIRSKGYVLSN
ncbi:winged helix-turn-helix domain-containing protein [Enterococcus rivorum]|uniref:OmpR/PhoB-type domain-containing protein n=1 Tax=Enterococcus rivorum TaxID=762845 RepID=A0A1E5L0L5_9ENTE|nr:winged helix-turn-helix domain-containing protein [Enterococcus rivorum]MBP2098479.1 two-component system response regulator VicR [Enterococcus rivorum]OEH83670.1 hypothetical protein BCR26_08360 [Enterococcus rivorum]